MFLSSKAKEEFHIEAISTGEMDSFIKRCSDIYQGKPEWLDPDNHINTINFAKSVCSEIGRLTTLAIGIDISGGARADWLQKQINTVYFNLRHWVEYGCAYGTILLKPNEQGVDVVFPGEFLITDCVNGEITGAVFQSRRYDSTVKKWFTRLEYHRFLPNGHYAVSNRCYIGETDHDPGRAISIEKTPWKDLSEDVEMENVEKPLFGVFRTPAANNITLDSPLGMPVFADALEELKDLDTAYSRNAKEIYDSKRMVMVDSDRLFPYSGKHPAEEQSFRSAVAYENIKDGMGLPDFVKVVDGNRDKSEVYHEINPELNTDTRMTGINAYLSQIGYKCGFSNGYFVFNERTGMVTATQVEADDRRTIQLIKDMRDKLEDGLNGLFYALSKMADLYHLAPVGKYEVVYDFGDITYNREEDRARWLGYVSQNIIPKWYYLVKFEGFSEEDAKKLIAEAEPHESPPFGDEE